MDKKRILLVHNSADFYGASRSLLRLCRRLRQTRFEAKVVLPEDGVLAEILRDEGTEVIIFPSLRIITRPLLKSWRLLPWLLGFLPAALALARLIKQHQINLVHTNTGVICSSALSARFAGVPHLWHIRDWFQEFGPVWKPYSKYILGFSKRVVCVSHAIAGQFPASPKVEVLSNGFDLAEFPTITEPERQASRERWKIPPNALVVGVVGRIKFVRKGQEVVIEAMSQLKTGKFPVYALFAGGNPPGADDQLPRMQALAHSLGVQDQVVFTGELTDPRPAYAAMDIFVLPSAQPEPFGGVVMEAMAYQLPVIGTALGGTIDQVEEGKTGFLVPPSNPNALALKMETLLQSKRLRDSMGHAGRQRIQAHFSMDAFFQKLSALYESILDPNH
jgi:glycosyltransferase involved in cell wall biosynthesis